jgi:hypothetical protein
VPLLLARCASCVAAGMAQGRPRAGIISLAKCPRLAFTARVRTAMRCKTFHREARSALPRLRVFLCPDASATATSLTGSEPSRCSSGNIPARQRSSSGEGFKDTRRG